MSKHTTCFLKLKGRMREQGWTQKELALELGITAPTLNALLSGRSSVTLQRAYQILEILRVPTSEIYEYFAPEEVKGTRKRHKRTT